MRWFWITTGAVTFTLVLKLAFTGQVSLIPEEAYYWNYARHLDFGYFDHPPMVGWLIWLATSLLGKSEWSIRLPAYLCWLITAAFMFRLTVTLCDRPAAYRTVMLVAVLPIYFGLGFFMTPDAPLCAAWAGSLYFLERALIRQDRCAWTPMGVCLGIAMMSKYSAALLGVTTLIFLIIDRQSHRWFQRREPYIAALIALALFSPVVFWNLKNAWGSFWFQGPARWSGSHHFAFHVLIGTVLLLLTPTGLLAITRVLVSDRRNCTALSNEIETARRQHLWVAIFTLVPLSVFVAYSFINSPKLNWTAPLWLAVLPFVARDMTLPIDKATSVWTKLSRRLWTPTVIGLLLVHTAFLYYVTLGLPGAGPMVPERLFGEWRAVAKKVDEVAGTVEAEIGSMPVIVGMDKNFISSELSFYCSNRIVGTRNIGGVHFFDQPSLMWARWYPRSAAAGKDLLMIDLSRKRLTSPRLAAHFTSLGNISMENLQYNGRVIGTLYWRVGRGYKG